MLAMTRRPTLVDQRRRPYVGFGLGVEARDERVSVSIGPHSGGVEVELASPDQPRLLTQIDDLLEETLEDVDPQPLPDAGQAGVVGQFLVEGVAQVPAVGRGSGWPSQ